MKQVKKRRKAADIEWGDEITDDGEITAKCEFIYYGILYSLKATYSRLRDSRWDGWSMDSLFCSIGDEMDKYQHSSIMQDLLSEKSVTLRVSSAEKWYEPGGTLRELPKGERQRKKELVSHFLADVLQDYLNHERDTPSRKELWEWLSTLCWRTGDFSEKWQVSGEPETGYTYTRKSDGATSKTPMTRDSFRTQFKRLINTTSYTAEFMKWVKKNETIEKMNNKKPRGRPRKKYP